ncbi:MAG: 5-formyltetrahydrofolate cyclo-ligase [Lachnospiraceae bacterium]|nr:5-formyltetrahydrofolate cyclo-ligase [Lachnospiraceae bacterium]
MTKKEARKLHRDLRDKIGIEYRIQAEKEICDRLYDIAKDRNIVFCYAAIGSEVNLEDLYKRLLEMGKKLAFPKVNGKDMSFFAVDDLTKLTPGTFNVPEPDEGCEKIYPKKDIFFVPGLCFSRDGSRIGYGAGYYDRYFKQYGECLKVGVCFNNQLDDDFVKDEFDISMDRIVCDDIQEI